MVLMAFIATSRPESHNSASSASTSRFKDLSQPQAPAAYPKLGAGPAAHRRGHRLHIRLQGPTAHGVLQPHTSSGALRIN